MAMNQWYGTQSPLLGGTGTNPAYPGMMPKTGMHAGMSGGMQGGGWPGVPGGIPVSSAPGVSPIAQSSAPGMPPLVPSGSTVTPGGGNIVTLPAIEESYIENILRLNRGKMATVYMTYENNSEWNAKIFKGIIEAAGRDHLILSDPATGMRYLLLTINLDYVTFDGPIAYEYPFQGNVVTNATPAGGAAGR